MNKEVRIRGNLHPMVDGDWDRDTHLSTEMSPSFDQNEEQKEGEHEQGNQVPEGWAHTLRQGDWSSKSLPWPAGLGLNEHVTKLDYPNMADIGTVWDAIDNGTARFTKKYCLKKYKRERERMKEE